MRRQKKKNRKSLVTSASIIKNELDGTKRELLFGYSNLVFSHVFPNALNAHHTSLSGLRGLGAGSCTPGQTDSSEAKRLRAGPKGRRGTQDLKRRNAGAGACVPQRDKKEILMETSCLWMPTEMRGQNGTT